jgi:hypothetical protein
VASKENKNKYLEVGNYDPLGYISLNKILEKIGHMFMKQNYGNAFQPIKGCYVLTCIRHYKLNGKVFNIDAPPNSLKDSNASPKVKTMKKIIGVRFLTRNISRAKGAC